MSPLPTPGQRELSDPIRVSRAFLSSAWRTGAGAVLLALIMFVGSLVMWAGTPLLWLWVGSRVQAATDSLGAALLVMFAGLFPTVWLEARVLGWLSERYRLNHRARSLEDPGHELLERVLVISAGIAVGAFMIWFLFLAGASPVPVGIKL